MFGVAHQNMVQIKYEVVNLHNDGIPQIPHLYNGDGIPQFTRFLTSEGIPQLPPFHNGAVEAEDVRESTSQWRWEEDKLLISAWLNVPVDPVVNADNTDQKGKAMWNRIHQYCEERNPGLIKRGPSAMKKRWHRINQGALRFGGCYDQACREIGNDSNMDNIMVLAHELFIATYKKKCNFDRHWSELRKEQKWKSPSTHSGSSKRTKMCVGLEQSACGAYSSSSNPEMPAVGDAIAESPICLRERDAIAESPICPRDRDVIAESPICPRDTKATKRKGKRKSKALDIEEILTEEIETVKSNRAGRLSLIEELKVIKLKEIEMKEKELDLQLLTADTSSMNELQREIHSKMLEKLKAKFN